jgi:imidazolonepropionase-like amidohydrolase
MRTAVAAFRGVPRAIAAFAALGAAHAAPIAVTNAVIHPVAGPVIQGGVLVADGGRIVAVGPAGRVEVPAGATVVDAGGLGLWPGMIDALSYLGLSEVTSVRGTVDWTETGQINPNARAEVAINASSAHVPVTRANGVLLAATLPRGSLVPGTAAAIALDGWTWEEMVRLAPVGLVVEWPAMGPAPRPDDDDDSPGRSPPDWQERVAKLDAMLEEARAYVAAGSGADAPARGADVRWESLRGVITGETPVWVHAGNRGQIRAALDWVERNGLRMVLVDGTASGAGDARHFAAELAERGIPVVEKTTRQPARRYEPYDSPFTAPGDLAAAGVEVAFGSWSSSNARNLPQEAARAVAFGMPREAGVRGVTLGAAVTLGIADRYGSLEPGKSATMILVEGDLLDVRMQVRRAWIDGREIDLETRHTELWKRWSSRPAPRTGG